MKPNKKRIVAVKAPEKKKKKPPYRLIIILTAILLALAAIIAVVCYFALRAPAVFTYKNIRVDTDTYTYWLACYKSSHVKYNDKGFEDTAEGWNLPYGEGTYLSYYTEKIDNLIKQRIVAAALYDAAGFRLTQEESDAILAHIEELYATEKENYVASTLKRLYNVNDKDLRQIALYEYKYIAYYYKVFGNDLSGAFSEELKEDAKSFYEDNYVRFKQVIISNDQSKNKDRASMRAAMEDGMTEEEFDLCVDTYEGDEALSTAYGDGIYLYKNASYAFDEEVLAKLYTLPVDGYAEVIIPATENNVGASVFIYRCPLEEDEYAKRDNYWFSGGASFPSFAEVFSSYIYQDLLNERISEVEVNHAAKAEITLISTPRCWEYNLVNYFH